MVLERTANLAPRTAIRGYLFGQGDEGSCLIYAGHGPIYIASFIHMSNFLDFFSWEPLVKPFGAVLISTY